MLDEKNPAEVATDEELDAAIEEVIAGESSVAATDEETTDTKAETSAEEGEDTKQETVSEETSDQAGKEESDEETGSEEQTKEESEETTEEEIVDYLKLYGLDKQYANTEEALRAVEHQNRTIGDLQYQLNQARQQEPGSQRQKTSTELDPEKLYENPIAALKEAGFINKVDVINMVNELMDKERANVFMASKEDLQELLPVMGQILRENPAIEGYGHEAGTKELYRMAAERKRQVTTQKPTVKVKTTDEDKKDRATTVGGKRGGGAKKTPVKTDKFGLTPQDYQTKPEEEILAIDGIFGPEG